MANFLLDSGHDNSNISDTPNPKYPITCPLHISHIKFWANLIPQDLHASRSLRHYSH